MVGVEKPCSNALACKANHPPKIQPESILENMRFFKRLFVVMAAALLATSCGTVEEYVLLNDLDTDAYYKMQKPKDLKIKRGDGLQIVVTHKLPQIVEMFNQSGITAPIMSENGPASRNESRMVQYTVNSDGYIIFPILDTLKVEGKTCTELATYIAQKIEEGGYANKPTVHVKITNFKVTVIGESSTGVYNFDNEHVTLLDLVAQANLAQGGGGGNIGGGLGIRRDKILVMREVNGVLYSEFVSLLSKDILYSPYFYLQQNDIIYVWPAQATIRNNNALFDFWWSRMSIATTAVSVVTLFVSLFQKKTVN